MDATPSVPSPDSAPVPSPSRFRHARAVLALSMMILGACGIIYEYTLGVLGNNLLGSSHEQIFVIIGLMMFSMGMGAALQRQVTGDLLDKFLGLELLLGLVGGTSSIFIYATFTFTASYQIVHYGVALLIGLIIGMEIPLLIRINEKYESSLRVNLSNILAMDYVGALFGALLFAYVLLSRLSLGEISFALGMVNTLLALLGALYFRPLLRRPVLLIVGSVAVFVLLGAGFRHSDDWVAHLEQRCFRDPIVHRETSRYQHLVLTRRGERVNLYINGRLQLSSSDEAIYHEMLVHMPLLTAPRRERVLILGGGDGLALREVLRHGDVREVALVDIDPAVVRLASEHPDLIELNLAAFHDARVSTLEAGGVRPGEKIEVRRPSRLAELLLTEREYSLAKVAVLHLDADLFLREAGDRYDVIILDFPDPESVELAKLYSVDFYRNLAARLAPGGVVSVQSTSPTRAREVFLCIGETLRAAGFEVMPYHQHVPSFGQWGWHLAWLPGTTETPVERLERLDSVALPLGHVTPEVLRASRVFGRSQLESDMQIVASTKMRPVLVEYYRQSWN